MTADHSGISPSGKYVHFKFLCSPKHSFKIYRAKIDRTKSQDRHGHYHNRNVIISLSKQLIYLTKDRYGCRSSAQHNKQTTNEHICNTKPSNDKKFQERTFIKTDLLLGHKAWFNTLEC